MEKRIRVSLFKKENGGLAMRNMALHAQREYILPLDCDDKIGKDYLYKGIAY